MLRGLLVLIILSLSTWAVTADDDKGETPANADPALLKKAPVVLRVKLDRDLGGETGIFCQRVTVLRVLKNESNQKFGSKLDVRTAVKNFGPGNSRVAGVPADECTIYLERSPIRNTGHCSAAAQSMASATEKKRNKRRSHAS